MFKLFAFVVLALACTVTAKPQFAVAPAIVTATSSQYFVRNYHGIAAAPVVAAAYTAPVAAAPYAAAPYAAYATPYSSFYPYRAVATYL